MVMIVWLAAGALGGWLFGRLTGGAMGALGDTLLGVGGGLAGGVMTVGLGLTGWLWVVLGGLFGGVAMVFLIWKLRDNG
jgi:hypothetical protein